MDRVSVLVTGGAGFIGSRLCESLAIAGYEVTAFDNLHPQVHGDIQCFEFSNSNIKFVYGDITDKEAVFKVVASAKPIIVYHMAAETGTGQSMDEVCRYTETNIQGTSNLIEAINQINSVQKIILPSSRAIYGEGAVVSYDGNVIVGQCRTEGNMKNGLFKVIDDNMRPLSPVPTKEDLQPLPVSIYASTKLMQEYLIDQAKHNKKWVAVILRLQNVYGPGQSLKNPYTGVLSIFSTQIMADKVLNIFEDGEIVRDFVYVDDVIDAFVRCIDKPIDHAEVINIGSGKPSRIIDVAKELLLLLGRSEDKLYISGDFRVGDIQYACADVSKAKNILAWQAKTNLIDGLSKLVDFVKSEN